LGSQEHYADDVAGVLELEQLDRNLFRGANASSARGRTALYGGQVAAQALKAAGLSLERNDGFYAFELRQAFFKLDMEAHRASDGANCAGSNAVGIYGFFGGFAQAGMIG
jgi:hypothetical protein